MIRKVKKSDLNALIILYKKAAKIKNGIARTSKEITKKYVESLIKACSKNGLFFVIENHSNKKKLIAAIECSRYEPLCFQHSLANLTLVVDPDFHGQGLGKKNIFAFT